MSQNIGTESLPTTSQRLLTLLKQYQAQKFILVEPGGNHGDYLIYKGFHKLAGMAGIEYASVKHDDFMRSDYSADTVIYLHGGGGFIPIWSGTPAEELRKSLSTHRGVVIYGPCTFVDDQDYLTKTFKYCFERNVSSRCVLFVREETSYDLIRDRVPRFVELDKDHDTALNLTREDLLSKPVQSSYKLYGIRHDKEMTEGNGYDYFNWLDPAKVTTTFEDWVMLHARAKEIITNRTHSSILGSILGVPTTLMANSYHKNRSIWEFSLRGRGVRWLGEIKPSCGGFNRFIGRHGRLRNMFVSNRWRAIRKGILQTFAV